MLPGPNLLPPTLVLMPHRPWITTAEPPHCGIAALPQYFTAAMHTCHADSPGDEARAVVADLQHSGG